MMFTVEATWWVWTGYPTMNGRCGVVMGASAGFTYITALVFVVIIGITLTTAGSVWTTVLQKEREQELLFAGDQIKRAIQAFYKETPGGRMPEYPRSLQELLKDSRYLSQKRYLRRVYRNPMSRDGKWEFVIDSRGGIKGVFAKSKGTPIKKANFPVGYENFEKAATYSDWKFMHGLDELAKPSTTVSASTQAAASSGTQRK